MAAPAEKLSVTAVTEPFGLNDIPIGTYRVPDTAFAVRKYTTVSTTAGAFGGLGALAAHSSGADASKATVDGVEGMFRVDMAAETMRVMKTLRAQGHAPRTSRWTGRAAARRCGCSRAAISRLRTARRRASTSS
jgi:hypothetical protein